VTAGIQALFRKGKMCFVWASRIAINENGLHRQQLIHVADDFWRPDKFSALHFRAAETMAAKSQPWAPRE